MKISAKYDYRCKAESAPMVMSVPQKSLSILPTLNDCMKYLMKHTHDKYSHKSQL